MVPVDGAATQSVPFDVAVSAGSGYPLPPSGTVAVTLSVVRSIRETVLSTSLVTQSIPSATATPAGCLPTGTAAATAKVPVAARARPTVVATRASARRSVLISSPSLVETATRSWAGGATAR